MTDQVTTPAEQSSQQQDASTVATSQPSSPQGNQPPAGFIEKARYDGLVRKVEELTLANRDLNNELSTKSSKIEQLMADITVKDTEKSVAVGERDTRIQTLTETSLQKDAELQRLKALELKLKVVKDMKRSDLVPLLDHIPDMNDEEALRTTLSTFADFTDTAVKAREEQLVAGVLPVGGGITSTQTSPSTREAWNKEINALPLGSTARADKVAEYGKWLEANQK